MPYFKNSKSKLFWLDDSSQKEILPDDCVEITDSEAKQIIDAQPKLTYEQMKELVK